MYTGKILVTVNKTDDNSDDLWVFAIVDVSCEASQKSLKKNLMHN